MDSLIQNVIDDNIKNYINIIANKFNLSKDELTNIWLTLISKQSPPSEQSNNPWDLLNPNTLHENKLPELIENSIPKVEKMLSQTCVYVFVKGTNVGKYCGCKTIKGSNYCSKHKKYETLEIKEKTIVPKQKKLVSQQVTNSPEVKPVDIILRKHKVLQHLWHIETGMVFKSEKEPYVIGKCVDDKLTILNVDDVNICKKYGFNIQEIIKLENKDALQIKESVSKIIDNDDCYHPNVSRILDEIQTQKL